MTHQLGLLVYPEQPSPYVSVAAPSRSLHPDSERARIPSASVLNTFGVAGSSDFRARGRTPRTCPADGTASTMSDPLWSGRSPSVAAWVAGLPGGLGGEDDGGGGLGDGGGGDGDGGGGDGDARSTGSHCGGHALGWLFSTSLLATLGFVMCGLMMAAQKAAATPMRTSARKRGPSFFACGLRSATLGGALQGSDGRW